MTDTPEITPRDVWSRLRARESLRVLDIRDRTAVEQWRLSGDSVVHTHIPRSKVLQAKALGTIEDLAADIDGEGPITVVCAEGRASDEIAEFLRDAGYDSRNLANGMDGWAALYEAVELDTASTATVFQYQRPSSGCLGYLVVEGDDAAVIDPLAAFTERYIADAADYDATLRYAVDTHVHADHVSGVRALAKREGTAAVVPQDAVERGLTIDATTVEDGDTLTVGDATLEAVHAPGHTTDVTAFAMDGFLFSGDSLFVESVARPDLEVDAEGVEDLARELYATLHDRFSRFGDETVVAPGHASDAATPADDGSYTASLGTLRESLALYGLSEAAFVDRITSNMPPRPANDEQIIAINLGQQTVETETALELELGPNNCAVAD